MSLTREVTVWCNGGCDRWVQESGQTAAQIRRGLRKCGWKTNLPGGVDICNKCAAKAKEPA